MVSNGIILATVLPFLVVYLYRRFKYRKILVNCWFCNENCRVDRQYKNTWVCPYCEQYNGFDQSGDYNREIREQFDSRLNGPAYARAETKLSPPPDVTSLQFPNGLCLRCNDNQSIKLNKIANFVPSREDRFDIEMEDYKQRLERLYALCENCQRFLDQKLDYQHKKLGISEVLKTKFKNCVSNVGSAIDKKMQRNLSTKKVGGLSRGLQLVSCACMCCMAFVTCIQWNVNSHAQIFNATDKLSLSGVEYVLRLYSWLPYVTALAAIAHTVAIKTCTARIILPDVLACICYMGLMVMQCFWKYILKSEEDKCVFVTGLCCITCMLSVWVLILPRKKLRRSKPKWGSCFSVASTPQSQRSSFVGSPSPFKSPLDSQLKSPFKSPFKSPLPPKNGQLEGMGLRQRRVNCSPDGAAGSVVGREATPSRELAPKLTNLKLGKTWMQRGEQEIRSPFKPATVISSVGNGLYSNPYQSTVHTQSGIFRAAKFNPTPSHVSLTNSHNPFRSDGFGICDDARSVSSFMTSVSQQRINRSFDSNSSHLTDSHSTSADTNHRFWKYSLVIFTVLASALLISTCINVIVLYSVWKK